MRGRGRRAVSGYGGGEGQSRGEVGSLEEEWRLT